GGLGALYRQLGYAPAAFSDGGGCLQRLAGRIYVDPNRWVQFLCHSFPWRHTIEQLQASPEHLYDPPDDFDPQRLDPWFLLKWPHLLWVLRRSRRQGQRLRQTAAQTFTSSTIPAFDAQLEQCSAIPAAATDVRSRIESAEQFRQWLFDEQLPSLLLPGWLGVQAWHEVAREVSSGSPSSDMAQRLAELLPHLESTPSSEPTPPPGHPSASPLGLWDTLSLELSDLTEVEVENGHPLARAGIGDPSRVAGTSSNLVEELLGQLSPAGRQSLRSACRLLPLRNIGRGRFLSGYRLLALQLQTIANQTGLGSLLYCLSWRELQQWCDAPVDQQQLQQRQSERKAWGQFTAPAFICGDAPHPFQLPVKTTSAKGAESWSVAPVSTGQTQGQVWTPTVADRTCPAGAIVVAESLSVADLWQWRSAAGFLVERGGLLSHAAVTARQLQLPLAIHPTATHLFRPGDALHLDATTGSVERLRFSIQD
ncbi:MAG: PEP-utilizing enzyme, partial [Planctomycetaceae bacterium]